MNDQKFYSFIGITKKSGNIISGYNNCENEIRRGKCKLVIIAEDASDNTKKKYVDMCSNNKINYIVYGNKEKLGLCTGKPFIAVMAIKNDGMSKVVLNMLK